MTSPATDHALGLGIVLVSRWASVGNCKREAVRAAHARDHEALAGLLEHHLRLESPRGASTSGETIRQYRTALGRFLNHCESRGLEIARTEPRRLG